MDLLDPVIGEWVSMILRWLHVVAGIAWIGSSFYFIHLDLSLRKGDGPRPAFRARPGRCTVAVSITWSNIWSPRRACPTT